MKNSNKVLLAGVLGLGLVASISVSANSDTLSGKNHMSGLIQAIAQRFNLNEKDVEQVFADQFVQHKNEIGKEHGVGLKVRDHGMKNLSH